MAEREGRRERENKPAKGGTCLNININMGNTPF